MRARGLISTITHRFLGDNIPRGLEKELNEKKTVRFSLMIEKKQKNILRHDSTRKSVVHRRCKKGWGKKPASGEEMERKKVRSKGTEGSVQSITRRSFASLLRSFVDGAEKRQHGAFRK